MDSQVISAEIWSRGYKTFFMLNSAEHKILNAHTYKNDIKGGVVVYFQFVKSFLLIHA